MPQKAKSLTKSQKSPTTDTPIQFVKGVGPRLAFVFSSRGIQTVKDMMFFFPRAYEDRTKLLTVSELQPEIKASTAVTVLSSRKIPTRSYGKSLFEVRCEDETGSLSLKWFHLPKGMEQKFSPGTHLVVTGKPKLYLGKPEIIHPEVSFGKTFSLTSSTTDKPDPLHVGRVTPIYVEIDGIPTRALRKILWDTLSGYNLTLTDDLPTQFIAKHNLPNIQKAVKQIHFPDSTLDNDKSIQDLVDFKTPYHSRLIYDEFFKFEFLVLKQKMLMEKESSFSMGQQGGLAAIEGLEKNLPFELTGDQKKAVREICKDLFAPHPMNRLVQGDVGSGKTAVALLSAGIPISEGFQVALMAPTEILAEQHFINSKKLFKNKIDVELFTGKTTTSERERILQKIAQGAPLLLIGTHALIEDPVQFKSLALVIIDEQHRFGVEQRRALRKKGEITDPVTGKKHSPHSLVLTATPIPRTLALTAYGDLDISIIQEMPPGRTPAITKVIRGAGRLKTYELVEKELSNGRQAYFIYPLVNESEADGFQSLKAATIEAEKLQKEVFPKYKVGLLHGQMKSAEKDAIMTQFKNNEIQILVSTTVVEVGVDVPNATVICIEHSERFGLSQLHQLRGRVGRGQHRSYCFYFTHEKTSENTDNRLEVLEKTHDGFEISEADLKLRGPGEFLGTKQAGSLPFKIADLVRDREWLLKAREDAIILLKSDPLLTLPENKPLRAYYEREGSLQFDRLKTS